MAKPKAVTKPRPDPVQAGIQRPAMATHANWAAGAPAPSSDDKPQDRRFLRSPPNAATGTSYLLQLLSSAGKNGN
ncbi:hypothetical protein N8506_03670 [Synechococcus sp. AH-601-N23]|nr:hypothetical protein [Synechococcus sp. AH-601-N23]